MKKVISAAAIFGLVTITAFAGETKKKGSNTDEGRGGLSDWPVSKKEADWRSATPASSSSGGESPSGATSTGEATQKMDPKETSDRTPEKNTETPREQKDAPGGDTSDRTPEK